MRQNPLVEKKTATVERQLITNSSCTISSGGRNCTYSVSLIQGGKMHEFKIHGQYYCIIPIQKLDSPH